MTDDLITWVLEGIVLIVMSVAAVGLIYCVGSSLWEALT